jgi:hypothetical protein
MNLEQGMSKEEGRGLSEEMATKKREERYKLTYLRTYNQSFLFVLCSFATLRSDYPSSFHIPCSTFFGSALWA